MGERYGFQFDVSATDFRITEGTQDTPPFAHSVQLTPKGSTSALDIRFGPKNFGSGAVEPELVFSKHVERRTIRDEKGQPIGEDVWGYLSSGERWRRAHLRGLVYAKYGFVDKNDAERFDRVISSACLSVQEGINN